MHYNLYSIWNLHKVKLYLNTCVTHTKIVLPNRVKNENIFDIAPVKPFSRDKSEYSSQTGFFVHFGEISYLVINKENKNDQEPGLIFSFSLHVFVCHRIFVTFFPISSGLYTCAVMRC
jgi:hypothetical protein